MCVRTIQRRIYDGELGQPTGEFDPNYGPALVAALRNTYWQPVDFGGRTYYQTFEYHIYRIDRERIDGDTNQGI